MSTYTPDVFTVEHSAGFEAGHYNATRWLRDIETDMAHLADYAIALAIGARETTKPQSNWSAGYRDGWLAVLRAAEYRRHLEQIGAWR